MAVLVFIPIHKRGNPLAAGPINAEEWDYLDIDVLRPARFIKVLFLKASTSLNAALSGLLGGN